MDGDETHSMVEVCNTHAQVPGEENHVTSGVTTLSAGNSKPLNTFEDLLEEKSEKCERRESVGVSVRTKLEQLLRETFVLVLTPGLRLKAFVVFYLWITSSAIYYGISLNSYNLSTNIYLYTFLGGLLEIPAYLLLWLATATLGRKKTFAILFLICGISISLLTTLMLLLQKVFSVGALVAAAVVFILPETTNKNMPQGIDEEEDDNDSVYSRDV
ncbi:hypothetical protein Pcinc_000401 [Petrolisthes cinctipes]|uniref:Uncharacterized protein n=1 Tax=Petrolisthes cinctipes TaxID=88211 RepID=A0AAE1GPP7_PETCI|nr:hypothetical protein Pcinc_000401 [Petrolisthes cinctipes]